MFGKEKEKTGIELLKEKLEKANQNMINAVEELKRAREVMNDFYKLLFEVEQYDKNNTNN